MKAGQKMTSIQKAKRKLRGAIMDWGESTDGAKMWKRIEVAIGALCDEVKRGRKGATKQ